MQHAIVTGAGGGIGSVIARTLAENGYRVGIFDMDLARAKSVADEIGGAVAVQCDVTNDASVEKALDTYGLALWNRGRKEDAFAVQSRAMAVCDVVGPSTCREERGRYERFKAELGK